MLKWKEEKTDQRVAFETLKIGVPFEWEDRFFIKIRDTEAYDIINEEVDEFYDDVKVLERDATITFH